jgi:hypothetical protein
MTLRERAHAIELRAYIFVKTLLFARLYKMPWRRAARVAWDNALRPARED